MKITEAKAIGFSSVVGGGIALTTETGKKFQVAFMGVNGGINKQETEELTAQFLSLLIPPKPAAEDVMLAFGASEAACILYPDDTELDRACRAAYIKGASANLLRTDKEPS